MIGRTAVGKWMHGDMEGPTCDMSEFKDFLGSKAEVRPAHTSPMLAAGGVMLAHWLRLRLQILGLKSARLAGGEESL